jgi:hypothetical protein
MFEGMMTIRDYGSKRWDDSSLVLTSIVSDVSRFYSSEVSILAIWSESPESVCVIYRRRQDPGHLWGHRLRFPPHAIKNDPASSGAAFAELLTEPAGTLFDEARQDRHGVTWLIPPGSDLPTRPDETSPSA